MKIHKHELNIKKEILINQDFDFNNFGSSGIKEVNKIHFEGKIYYNVSDELKMEGKLIGELILTDAVDLSDVLYPISINIDEIIKNNENILDINEILWENIVLEVPIRVTNKELTKLEGDGWKILNEDNEDKIDPRLQKLQELFKGGE